MALLQPRERILITGAGGMAGRALTRELQGRHDLLPLPEEQLDVTDEAGVERAVSGFRPHVIVHLGAWTDVDGCELDPGKAHRVNGEGTRHVAEAARRHRARMLYVSTDYVFDGTATSPIPEDARPNPLNAYGRTKLEGELAVRKALTDYYIARTSWVYGEGGRNFVDTVVRLAGERQEIQMVEDQVGSPTYAPDLAAGLARLLESQHFGIFHVTNAGECSWFTLAQEILSVLGSNVHLAPVTTDEFPRPARRPHYSVLGNYRLHHVLGYRLRSWREAVREYLETTVMA